MRFRPIEHFDLELLRQHRNDPETWDGLTDAGFITEADQERWFEAISQPDAKRRYMMAASDDDIEQCLGIVRMDELDHTHRSVRVGCDVFKQLRKRGVGTQIMQELLAHAFDVMNMHRVWLLVAEWNEAALGLYQKLGFSPEGCQRDALFRHGKYHDYLMMSILQDEYRNWPK